MAFVLTGVLSGLPLSLVTDYIMKSLQPNTIYVRFTIVPTILIYRRIEQSSGLRLALKRWSTTNVLIW
jgi:hypothetical protein